MSKKNHRLNELYVGKEFINIEGRTIKHPALIEHYANIDTNKTREEMIHTIGIDIETNHLTGEMKLFGFYEGNSDDYSEYILEEGVIKKIGYRHYTNNFLLNLLGNVRIAVKRRKSMAHWNKLDAFQIFRLFALQMDDTDKLKIALKRFDHIQGDWNRNTHKWEVLPVIAVVLDGYEFGIMKVIRGSIQYFIKSKDDQDVRTCWSYNIASLYIKGLEKEADSDKGGRFDWYSKVDEEAHLVDWERFYNDVNYRENIVLKSNCLDAKSAMALAYEVQKDFKESFGAYPTSLISQGSHARSAVVAQVENDLREEGYIDWNLQEKKYQEINSISFVSTLDYLIDRYDNATVKDFYLMCTEAYSGGYIDTIRYGYCESGWYADIASAYPAVIQKLFDLRNCRMENGKGEPPKIENAYIVCRGLVTIPESLQFHPITIKHPNFKDTNIRPTGTFYASYTSEERDYVIKYGGSFRDEVWSAIITEGKSSVLSKVSLKLIDIRNELIKAQKRAEGQVKRIGNSLYGILYEAVPIHQENDELLPEKIGYRAGEFWNPLYATFITSRTRIIEAEASMQITANGGEVILLMTDSILWKGRQSDLPKELDLPFGLGGIKKKKTLGFYEPPDEVKDIICFGAGRYGFYNETNKKVVSKRRGMVIVDYVNHDKIDLDDGFTWHNFIKLVDHYKTTDLKVITRKLISTGILANSLKYKLTDLGRIVEEEAELDLIAGRNKRLIIGGIIDPQAIITSLVPTQAIYLDYNVHIEYDYMDGTLPILRNKVKGKKLKSKKIRKKESNRERQKRFREKNKIDINKSKKEKYKMLKSSGFSPTDASLMSSYSDVRLNAIIQDKKIT